jgi:hypothetical protein
VRFRPAAPEVDEPLRDALGPALGRELGPAWRLVAGEASQWPRENLIVELEQPGGIERAWWAPDPTRRSSVALDVERESGRLVATWRAGYRGQRELFVEPAGGVDRERPPRIRIRRGAASAPLRAPNEAERKRGVVLSGRAGEGRRLELTLTVVPTPEPGASELIADDPALREQLRALGYLVGEDRLESRDSAE